MSKETWTKQSLDEAFRPYLEHESDPSPQARKRARILRAATELFERQGFRKTTIDEIAKRAEVAKGTVYVYYESKAKLLVHAIALQKKSILKAMQPLFTGEVPERARLHYWVRLMLASARHVPLAARLLKGDGELEAALEEVSDNAQYEENQKRGVAWIEEMIEQAAPGRFSESERRDRACALFSMGFVSVMLLEDRMRAGRSFEETVDTLADIVTYGAIHRAPQPEGAE